MRIYLVRHGIAAPLATPQSNDAKRPLTASGIRKMRLAARGLARLIPRSAILLVSPATRTMETARLIYEECGFSKKARVSRALAPNVPPNQVHPHSQFAEERNACGHCGT